MQSSPARAPGAEAEVVEVAQPPRPPLPFPSPLAEAPTTQPLQSFLPFSLCCRREGHQEDWQAPTVVWGPLREVVAVRLEQLDVSAREAWPPVRAHSSAVLAC